MMKNTQSHRAIAYLGGTFDPVHYGHLRLAEALADQLQLNVVNLLPCHIPPHKATPKVDTRTRSKMLQLATQDNPTLRIDERELKRNKPSYTIDTLKELRAEHPDTPLLFAIGMDSFVSLHKWHKWQQLLSYCHLVVFSRPGYPFFIPTELDSIRSAITPHSEALHSQPCGNIWVYQQLILDISSSDIRDNQRNGRSNRYLLPDAVNQFIQEAALYS